MANHSHSIALATFCVGALLAPTPLAAQRNYQEYAAGCRANGGIPHPAGDGGPLRCDPRPTSPTQGYPDPAVAAAQQRHARDAGDAQSRKEEGIDYLDRHDWPNAIQSLEEAVDLRPDDQELADLLAEARAGQAQAIASARATQGAIVRRNQAPDSRLYLIGAATATRGEVTFIYPTGQRVRGAAAAGAPLPLGAHVVTGSAGRVEITLVDHTHFTIGANSDVVLDRFVFDPDNSPTAIAITVAKGFLRWVTGHMAGHAPGSLSVTTPVAVLGPRGTDFEVVIRPGGSGQFVLHNGELAIQENGTGRRLVLHAGQTLRYENYRLGGVQGGPQTGGRRHRR